MRNLRFSHILMIQLEEICRIPEIPIVQKMIDIVTSQTRNRTEMTSCEILYNIF